MIKLDYDDAIKDFEEIFNKVSELNERNEFDEKLKDRLFEF